MSLFHADLAADLQDPEFRRNYLASTIELALRQQLGNLAVGTGTYVIVDTTRGYEEDAGALMIDCDTIADAVLQAIQEQPTS